MWVTRRTRADAGPLEFVTTVMRRGVAARLASVEPIATIRWFTLGRWASWRSGRQDSQASDPGAQTASAILTGRRGFLTLRSWCRVDLRM
jgi:hypothetical protein